MKNRAYTKILEQFSTYIAHNLNFSGRTKFNYPKIVEYYLNYLEAFNIECLSHAEYGMMIKFAKFRGDKKYAAAYVNLRLSALKTFYTWAYKNHICNNHLILEYKKSRLNNSLLSVEEKNENSAPIISLQPEEQEMLLNVVIENEFTVVRNKCIVELILASAISAAEVVCAPFTALNLKKGYIDIVDTNRERRVVLDTSICLQSCDKWLKFRKNALPSKNHCPFLFFTKNFEQLTKRMLYNIVSQYLLKTGVVKEHLGADILRQTAICNMFRNQQTLEEVQKATGIQTLLRLEKYRLAAEHILT
jgi:site-specific recombinase XerD